MNWQPPPGQGPQPWPPATPAPAPGYPPPPVGGPVYELSGWWRRVGAALIDGILVGIASTIVALIVGADITTNFDTSSTGNGANAEFNVQGPGLLISLVMYVLIVVVVMAKNDGRTVGKMATGIRVVREDGRPVDFGFAFLREFVIKEIVFGLLSFLTLFIGSILNYLWPLWDEQHRALHDRIVKSRVVRTDAVAGGRMWGPGYPPPGQQPFVPPPQPVAPPYGAPPPPVPGQPPAAPPVQPPFPVAPPSAPAPPPPPAPPPATQPPAQSPPAPPLPPAPPVPPGEYQPPPGFDNPVPPDRR